MRLKHSGRALPCVLVGARLRDLDLGGCQKYVPFLGTLNFGCRIIIGIQKGTIILTTNHLCFGPTGEAAVERRGESFLHQACKT